MEQHPTKLVDDARKLIAQCGLSAYEVARRSGIDLSQLRGFQRFGKGLSLQSLDRVLSVVGDIRLAEAEPTEQPVDQPSEPPPAGSGLDQQFLSNLL